MREKLQSLPVSELRAIAKENGIKSVTKLRKQQLVDMILEVNERNQKKQTEAAKKEEVDNENKENIQVAEVSTEEKEDKPEKEVKKKKSENKEKNSESNKELKTEKKNSHKLEGKTEHRIIKTHSKNENKPVQKVQKNEKRDPQPTDEGDFKSGILEVMPDGFGFIRCDNYMPGDDDVYVAPSQIKRFNLKTGDILEGKVRAKRESEKFGALYYLDKVNDESLEKVISRPNFEDLTPIFPNNRLQLETPSENMAMRIVDIISPIGKGQRGMIVSPPKAGKTTLLKQVAKSIQSNNPEMKMIILLIDERPEEVTDIKEAIEGENVEVIYSTFDELPEHHKRVSEMVIERAKRLVEHLRKNNLGRASFLPISSVKGKKLDKIKGNESGVVGIASDLVKYNKKYEQIILNLLGRTVIVDNMDTAIKVAKQNGLLLNTFQLLFVIHLELL